MTVHYLLYWTLLDKLVLCSPWCFLANYDLSAAVKMCMSAVDVIKHYMILLCCYWNVHVCSLLYWTLHDIAMLLLRCACLQFALLNIPWYRYVAIKMCMSAVCFIEHYMISLCCYWNVHVCSLLYWTLHDIAMLLFKYACLQFALLNITWYHYVAIEMCVSAVCFIEHYMISLYFIFAIIVVHICC